MGDAVRTVDGLAIDGGDHPTGNSHRMASEEVSPLLDMEVLSGRAGRQPFRAKRAN
jgi:hypothetical protein